MSDKSHTLTHLSGADQKTHGGPEPEEKRPSHEQGTENSHLNLDAKDQKSIANKLDQASKQEKREAKAQEESNNEMPTDAARNHGNEPSKGAKIDEQIILEEQAELRKKGIEP